MFVYSNHCETKVIKPRQTRQRLSHNPALLQRNADRSISLRANPLLPLLFIFLHLSLLSLLLHPPLPVIFFLPPSSSPFPPLLLPLSFLPRALVLGPGVTCTLGLSTGPAPGALVGVKKTMASAHNS